MSVLERIRQRITVDRPQRRRASQELDATRERLGWIMAIGDDFGAYFYSKELFSDRSEKLEGLIGKYGKERVAVSLAAFALIDFNRREVSREPEDPLMKRQVTVVHTEWDESRLKAIEKVGEISAPNSAECLGKIVTANDYSVGQTQGKEDDFAISSRLLDHHPVSIVLLYVEPRKGFAEGSYAFSWIPIDEDLHKKYNKSERPSPVWFNDSSYEWTLYGGNLGGEDYKSVTIAPFGEGRIKIREAALDALVKMGDREDVQRELEKIVSDPHTPLQIVQKAGDYLLEGGMVTPERLEDLEFQRKVDRLDLVFDNSSPFPMSIG